MKNIDYVSAESYRRCWLNNYSKQQVKYLNFTPSKTIQEIFHHKILPRHPFVNENKKVEEEIMMRTRLQKFRKKFFSGWPVMWLKNCRVSKVCQQTVNIVILGHHTRIVQQKDLTM